jgi:hypothetical protein
MLSWFGGKGDQAIQLLPGDRYVLYPSRSFGLQCAALPGVPQGSGLALFPPHSVFCSQLGHLICARGFCCSHRSLSVHGSLSDPCTGPSPCPCRPREFHLTTLGCSTGTSHFRVSGWAHLPHQVTNPWVFLTSVGATHASGTWGLGWSSFSPSENHLVTSHCWF